MKCRITQFARESVGLCPFRSSYVREFELSHSNSVNRIITNTDSCTQFAREDVGLCSIYNSYLKQLKLFIRKFLKRLQKITSAFQYMYLQLNYATVTATLRLIA